MREMIQGKIYKLVNTTDDQIYVGSTVSPLSKRFYQHKEKARIWSTRLVYAHLVPIGWDNVRIILIENYQCASKEELRAREQYYIDFLRPSLNKLNAINTCPHGRSKCDCKECGGTGICQHNRLRSQCKECGGVSICPHNKIRNRCKECGGASICPHNQQRRRCKDCHGSSICSHNLTRYQCKDCSPKECDFCNIRTSTGLYKKHLRTKKHKNYVAESLRVFEMTMELNEVPE